MFRLNRPIKVWRREGWVETAAEDKERKIVPVENCTEHANKRFYEGERLHKLADSPEIKSQTKSFSECLAGTGPTVAPRLNK